MSTSTISTFQLIDTVQNEIHGAVEVGSSAIPTKAGNWKVYIYGAPMRLNDPIVRRYTHLRSARAAVKRFAAEGKRAIVADDPAVL
jgi:hypothetical protein